MEIAVEHSYMARRRRRTRRNNSIELAVGAVLLIAAGAPIVRSLIDVGAGYWQTILTLGALACLGYAGVITYRFVKGKIDESNAWHTEAQELGIQRVVSVFRDMDPFKFEHHISRLFAHQRYKVKVTRRSNDKGIDILLTKKGEITAVQVKRYAGSVGSNEIREFLGSFVLHGTKRGIFVTTGSYSKEAIVDGTRVGIEMIDGAKLEKMIEELFPNEGYMFNGT
jgi:hypothetical protein